MALADVPTTWRCAAGAILPGRTAKFRLHHGSKTIEGFIVNHDGRHYAYVNRCPHAGSPLNWMPDRFLDRDREHILCTAHGALFEIESGLCIAGPCPGASLTTVRAEIRGGDIWIDE